MSQDLIDLASDLTSEDIFVPGAAKITTSRQIAKKEFGAGTTQFASVTLSVAQSDDAIRLGLLIADRLVQNHLDEAMADE